MGRGEGVGTNDILGRGIRLQRPAPKLKPDPAAAARVDDYEMYSETGNALVTELVADVVATYRNIRKATPNNRPDFSAWVRDGLDEIARSGCPECHDTAVREAIYVKLVAAGLPDDGHSY